MLVVEDYEVRRAVWGMEMVRRMNFTVPIRTENSLFGSVKPTAVVKKGSAYCLLVLRSVNGETDIGSKWKRES